MAGTRDHWVAAGQFFGEGISIKNGSGVQPGRPGDSGTTNGRHGAGSGSRAARDAVNRVLFVSNS